jgi:hypothetical protein
MKPDDERIGLVVTTILSKPSSAAGGQIVQGPAMGSHTPTLGEGSPRTLPASGRDKRRAKPPASHVDPPQELTPSEAELAARLSQALEYAPARKAPETQLSDQPTIATLINAPPLHDIDDVTAHARRAKLPTLADDTDEPNYPPRNLAPTWLRRSNRTSWRDRLSSLSAWLITTFVILAITGSMAAAILGPTRSATLLAIMTDEVREIALTLAASGQRPAP